MDLGKTAYSQLINVIFEKNQKIIHVIDVSMSRAKNSFGVTDYHNPFPKEPTEINFEHFILWWCYVLSWI